MVERFGKYQVLELVGEGGFGRVYRGFDPVLKREVAVKTCHLHSAELKERFIQEAEIAASLRHPGIVTVFDFGEQEGVPYLVQEYLSGEDLDALLARGEPVGLEARVWILRQAAEALQYAHSRGVVHRDVKPGNLRVEADGVVRLMDFGIARLVQTDRNLTQMGFSLGTVGYLSPEQLLGRRVDHRADIFSFGVLAYEVLTGRKPFQGDSVTAVLYAIANAEPEAMDRVVPGVPPALAALVERCLRKPPEERFSHMGHVVEELDRVREGLRGSAATLAAPSGVGGWEPGAAGSRDGAGAGLRRSRLGLGAGAVAVAALAVLSVATFSRGAEERGGDPLRDRTAREVVSPPVAAEVPPASSLPIDGPAGSPEAGVTSLAPSGSGPAPMEGAGAPGLPPPDAPHASRPPPPPSAAPVVEAAPAVAAELDRGRLVLIRGGEDPGWDRAEASMVERWLAAGLRVPDPASLDPVRAGAASRGEGEALRSLARETGAAMLVVATLRTGAEPSLRGFFTGSAELVLRTYDGATGEMLGAETVLVGAGGVPGKLGPTPEGALGDAAEEAGLRGALTVARRAG